MPNETRATSSTAFVAAVDNVIQQNRRLREVVASHKSVRITGPNSHPVYATGDLVNDCILNPGGLNWCVKLRQVEYCPIRALTSIEVRVEDSPQPIFREKDNNLKSEYAWDDKLPFLIGLVQPGYVGIGMQVEGSGKKAKRTGGLFTLFNVHRKSRGFMLPENLISSEKSCQFSSLIIPIDHNERDAKRPIGSSPNIRTQKSPRSSPNGDESEKSASSLARPSSSSCRRESYSSSYRPRAEKDSSFKSHPTPPVQKREEAASPQSIMIPQANSNTKRVPPLPFDTRGNCVL